jgi:hypothetical protein
LGGEPFYQKQFDNCIDFFSENPAPQLEFNVISNLMLTSKLFQEKILKIRELVIKRKLKRFDLTASIDCFGKEQEYVRYGLDLNQWKENFKFLVSQRWITLNINQTLSCLTMKTVPELIKFVNRFRKDRKIGHYFSTTVMTYEFLHPGIFGPGFFDFDSIINEMPTVRSQESQAKKYMEGIKLQVNSCARDQEKINQLVVYLDEIDQRRGISWREVFPWLEKEVTNVV